MLQMAWWTCKLLEVKCSGIVLQLIVPTAWSLLLRPSLTPSGPFSQLSSQLPHKMERTACVSLKYRTRAIWANTPSSRGFGRKKQWPNSISEHPLGHQGHVKKCEREPLHKYRTRNFKATKLPLFLFSWNERTAQRVQANWTQSPSNNQGLTGSEKKPPKGMLRYIMI